MTAVFGKSEGSNGNPRRQICTCLDWNRLGTCYVSFDRQTHKNETKSACVATPSHEATSILPEFFCCGVEGASSPLFRVVIFIIKAHEKARPKLPAPIFETL
jgi:hypothetical protein